MQNSWPPALFSLHAFNGWDTHRASFDETPRESREVFLARLRRTVHRLNEHKREDALTLATNQKERAQDVIDLDGARTKW